jgi:hypothetical protein
VAILTSYGTGGAALLPYFQMAAFALAVKSIFQVQHAGPGMDQMASLTLLDRRPLPPAIATAGKVMMAGGAGHASGFMGLVLEKHRTFGPGLELVALQGTYRFGNRGAEVFGAQKHKDNQSQKERVFHLSPGARDED